MPVLRFRSERLLEALEVGSIDRVVKLLERLKGEVTVVEGGRYVEVEYEMDRPDLYTVEGIKRAAWGLLGRELGLPRYRVVTTDYIIEAEDVSTRPYIAGAVVWDVNVDEHFLEELIQFQEKLHQSLGGNRARVAIGLHDLRKLPSKRLKYVFERADAVTFTPLGLDREMKLSEVLASTEQGRKYGRISLARDGRHPVLYSGDDVISVPPVVNAELTRIEPGTRDVFIDVTGTELRLVLNVLYVLAANLAERSRARKIGLIKVKAPWGEIEEPRMEARHIYASAGRLLKYSGLKLTPSELVDALRRCRFEAQLLDDRETVRVDVPPYRIDVLNWVDLVEDLIVAVGIDAVRVRRPQTMMRGRLAPHRAWERRARKVLVGLGLTEVYTYTLVPCRLAELLLEEPLRPLELSNPVSAEMSCYRSSVAAALLRVVARSQYKVPVKVFELGDVLTVRGGAVVASKRLGLAIANYKAGFEDVQAIVYALLRNLGDSVEEVRPTTLPGLLEGRAARLTTKHGLTAVLGEVHPGVLEELGIEYPVAVAEIDYTKLAGEAAAVPRP